METFCPQGSALAGKYLTFLLQGETYGLEILKVQEIIGLMCITRVPKTPEFIRGVFNLRGRVIDRVAGGALGEQQQAIDAGHEPAVASRRFHQSFTVVLIKSDDGVGASVAFAAGDGSIRPPGHNGVAQDLGRAGEDFHGAIAPEA